LEQVKTAEEILSFIYAHPRAILVNVYHRTIGGANDPYGVKVIL
tara:strand:- start:548 stop:679 length:132 start_codon:yes stop_codon:yes gene_type:complete